MFVVSHPISSHLYIEQQRDFIRDILGPTMAKDPTT
jgi:hypothetical protein